MFTIERATARDFERVYAHLFDCFGGSLPKEHWRRIFLPRWESPEDFCGLMLLKDGRVRGYLGLIFSARPLDGRVEKFCNMTSWCVDEDSRGRGLSLLLEALKLKGYTFTNFTASPTVAAILARLGFAELDIHQQVALPAPPAGLSPRGWACEFDVGKIRGLLGEQDRVILDDHQELDCEHVLLRRPDAGQCYVVLKKTQRKNLPFAKVHYLSDAGVFADGVGRLALRVCARLRVLGVMVDERYLAGRPLRASARYPHQRKAYYKAGSAALAPELVDTLYSELVVLHS